MSFEHRRTSGSEPNHGRSEPAPGKSTLTGKLQRKAGPQAGSGSPAPHWQQATAGAAAEVPHRAEMETSFGRSFGDVKAYLGGEDAVSGLLGLGARAAAHGNQVAFRDANPDRGLVAHELAHVVQQDGAASGVQAKSVGASGGSAEQRADAAADAVLRGEPVGDVGSADSDVIQCAVDTYGGSWDTTEYRTEVPGDGRVGAHIHLTFLPTDLVEAPSIGITQSVKTLTNSAAAGAVDQASLISANKRTTSLTTGDVGRSIDQGDGGNTANTNPLYAVENPAPPAAASASLTDVGADTRFGDHGHRIRRPDGTFDVKSAELDDTPTRRPAFPGQEFRGTFEATALVLDGPMRNTYLGSVEWGYRIDATATPSIDPNPIRVLSMGTPSGAFMDAADLWNTSQVQDDAGALFDTVNLPTSRRRPVDPASLDDHQLHERIRELADLLMTMDRTSVDYQQVRFESRGLAQAAVTRGATAADSGHTFTVTRGDSLWRIASRQLGAGSRWTQIFALNRGEILDPNRIATGQVLKMPVPFRGAAHDDD